MANYEEMSLAELKEAAKARGLKSVSTMRKQELVDILISVEKKMEELKKKIFTEDDLKADNNEFGYVPKKPKLDFHFEIAIEYKLTQNGFEITIPGNSIKEENGEINQIILFPNYIIH